MDDEAYRERLAHDVAAWRRAALISDEQERAILARIGAGERRAVGALRLGWLVSAVAVIAAIVLGAGVVLLFAANWQAMPSALRVGALCAGIAASYGAGYALIERYQMERIGGALLLLGVILYNAAVFLVARVYHVPVDSPVLWLLAAAGTFPLAYLYASRIVLLLAIGGVTGWVVAQMVAWYPDSPKSQSAALVVGALAVALYAAGRLHGERASLRRFADVYALSGLLVLLGLVYVFTFARVWDAVIDSGVRPAAAPPVVYVVIGLAALVAAAAWLVRPADPVRRLEAAAQAGVLALAAVVATWPAWTGYALVFDAVYFALAGALIVRGYLLADEPYINFGLATLAVGLLTRYVDVFWSQMATSAFFIVGGLLLFAVAFAAERLRRSLLREMRDGREPPAAAGATGAPA